jgi:hypothetical protein
LIKIIRFELTAKTAAKENIPQLLRHIASVVEEGFLRSDYPEWEIKIEEIEKTQENNERRPHGHK